MTRHQPALQTVVLFIYACIGGLWERVVVCVFCEQVLRDTGVALPTFIGRL